jgi:3'-phosphoadenosine 5'-phosphosulfate sulfotransferase (PAPS reductase)/FAD synthetase
MELWLPLHDWTDEQVFAYLALRGVKLPRIYEHTTQGPDCARCSAWWSEGRRDYLKEYHPELWAEYDARLQVIIDAIAPSLAMLRREAGVV